MQASHRNEKADLKINFVDFNVFSRISLVNVSRILVLHLLTGLQNAHIIYIEHLSFEQFTRLTKTSIKVKSAHKLQRAFDSDMHGWFN